MAPCQDAATKQVVCEHCVATSGGSRRRARVSQARAGPAQDPGPRVVLRAQRCGWLPRACPREGLTVRDSPYVVAAKPGGSAGHRLPASAAWDWTSLRSCPAQWDSYLQICCPDSLVPRPASCKLNNGHWQAHFEPLTENSWTTAQNSRPWHREISTSEQINLAVNHWGVVTHWASGHARRWGKQWKLWYMLAALR